MKAAVISREGLGDGLLMMIVAHYLKNFGYNVTFFHKRFQELNKFFKGFEFLKISDKNIFKTFEKFDLIVIEHYSSEIIKKLMVRRENFKRFYVIYPTCKKKLQRELNFQDFFCDRKKTMAENLISFLEKILNSSKNLKKTNGIFFPHFLRHRFFKKRIIIAPTSNDPKKNWRKKRFLKLYKILKSKNFDPIISLGPHEKDLFENENVKTITFKDFEKFASFVFESFFLIGNDSGPAHLASSLNIPSIVIASSKRAMRLWKPDFFESKLILPPFFLPNPKGLRIKDKYFGYFISTKRVIKNFNYYVQKYR
jgi:ADP-heptose:LPS heptosyltransferase